MNKNKIIVAVAVLIIVAGGCFYGGMLYQKNTNQSSFSFNREQLANRPANSNGLIKQGNGLSIGEIISKDDTGITIKLVDGGSKIIFLSNSTEIDKTTNGSLEDLEIGTNVTIQGSANSDGSITAQSIQIRPTGQDRPSLLQ
jgi:hypothetical protein